MKQNKFFSIVCMTTLLAISIFASGCNDIKPEPYIEDTATPTATATAASIATATATPVPATDVTATSTALPQEYMIRIDNYMFIPSADKEINVGDTIQWRNFEDTRQARYLVNENGIWEEEIYLPYMRSVSYTFNETGIYTFYLKGRDTMILTINVV